MSSIEAIINRQLLLWEKQSRHLAKKKELLKSPAPIITVSRQKGSRGSYFAERLADYLGFTRLHKEIIDTICASSGYRKRIVEALDSGFHSDIEILAQSLLTGKTIDHADYYHHLFKTVISLSKLGGVVLLGRGGNFILGRKVGFHIRVIAPFEKRVENYVQYKYINKEQAVQDIQKAEKERETFAKKIFDKDINNPEYYDLVINSSYIDVEDMIKIAGDAYEAKFNKLKYGVLSGR